ncbi:MAG: 2-hydroxyacyl-CoA dehydratase [Firmicutes bacterium]|nr:2-hydroxyacyl-CoA dehydratase [Bacillota bacterium]
MTQKKAKDVVKELQAEYYAGALKAKEEGKTVAWVTSIAPREILEAMDIVTMYPENHAAAVGAKKDSMNMIAISEAMGYSSDICSYARVNMGYVEAGDCAAGKMPTPDLVFCCNNICNTVTKWYEILARRLNVPLVMIDTPFSHGDEVDDHAAEYMVGQFKEAIRQLEQITGRKFDYDRFREVLALSSKAATIWHESLELGRAIPSPLNGLDFFNYMALAVCMRGNQKAVDFFTLLRDELAEKKARGESAIGGEKYRILWDGIPFWYDLKFMSDCLRSYQACMVASTYPDNWSLIYDIDDLKTVARAYASIYVNTNFNSRIKKMVKMVTDFSVDGVIMHVNRSCKPQDFAQYAMARETTRLTGVPVVLVDGDQTDPRAFSQAQFETRVQALFEMIEQRKRNAR